MSRDVPDRRCPSCAYRTDEKVCPKCETMQTIEHRIEWEGDGPPPWDSEG